MSNKKFVILGGGAAGILIAMKLANQKGLDIILIDQKYFYEYTPGLCSVLYEKTTQDFENHFEKITFDYRTFATKHHIQFIRSQVASIDDNQVSLTDHDPVPYDTLVICTGSSYEAPWKVQETYWDERLESLRKHRRAYLNANRILCIGGGPVGTELVAEIAERSPSKYLVLVDRNPTVLSKTPPGVHNGAQQHLKSLAQVNLYMEESCYEQDGHYMTDSGHVIATDLVYNCIGVKPNTGFIDPLFLNDRGQVKVDDCLQVRPNVFAVGDVNAVDEPKMFYTAHMQAVHIARHWQRPVPYPGVRLNMVVSLGPSRAIGTVSGIVVDGCLGALFKYLIEKVTMTDKLKLILNDILYFTQKK